MQLRVAIWWCYGGSLVVLWWFYGGANTRSALPLYYHLCLIDTTYVMLWCPNYYLPPPVKLNVFIFYF